MKKCKANDCIDSDHSASMFKFNSDDKIIIATEISETKSMRAGDIVKSVNSHKTLLDAAKYFKSFVDADLLDSITRGGNKHEDAIQQGESL